MNPATPASLTRRYTADAIDAAIVWTPVMLLIALAAVVGTIGPLEAIILLLVGPLVNALYRVLMMRRSGEHNGQTLGRELLSVRVATVSGRPLTGGDAAIREILWKSFVFGSLGSCLLGIPMLLDLLSPLWHPQRRAWHDQLCETVVVDARTSAAPRPATVAAAPAAAATATAAGAAAAPVGQPLAFDPPGAAPPPPPAAPTTPVAAPPPPPPPAPQSPPPGKGGPGRGLLVFAVLALAAVLAAAGAFAVTQLRDDSDADSAELSRDDWFVGGGSEGGAVEDEGSEESETSGGEAVLPDLSEEEMATEISDLLLTHHAAIAEGDFQRAWETLSSRKRRQYQNEEEGYSTWRENQTTLTSYLDPDDVRVEILGVSEDDGVVTVRVSGMGWSAPGSDCTEWSGITWVKFERGDWYYDPGYSTTPTRERSWKSRYDKLLGGSC